MLRYALTIFVSAFLLFQVQPLMGRFVLPWFGGGPSIWTTCMLFFQLLLLGGYIYAHVVSTKLSYRAQVATHISMLALSLVFLPIVPSDAWKPLAGQSPVWQILLLMLATVGGPYFMLSTTGPLLQRWFSRTSPGESPYRLYALSNVGSLLALLSYPFLFEPWLELHQQAIHWTIAYLVFAVLVAWCALRMWRQLDASDDVESVNKLEEPTTGLPESGPPQSENTESGNPESAARRPGIGQMLLWLGLSACGSIMLLATTNQLCIDVATVPFLWVLPLSIYLLSFILCFDNPRWYDRRIFGVLLLVAGPTACWVLKKEADVAILDQIGIYSSVLFICCMCCHGELVQCKPHPKYLTLFFMLVSAGGALGGLSVAIVATEYFLGYWEYHLGLAASSLLTLSAWCWQRAWLNRLVPAFWIWLVAISAQASALAYFLLQPLSSALSSEQARYFYAAFGLSQLLGLVLTVAWNQIPRRIGWAWIALTVAQLVVAGYYLKMHFPILVSPRMLLELSLGISLPCALSLLALWLLKGLGEAGQQRALRFLFVIAITSALVAFWQLRSFERWQIEILATAIATAVLIELGVTWLRPSGAKSWGLWYWLPAGTLLTLLSLQLVHVAKEDDELVHVSRNFYGVLKVKYKEDSDVGDGELIGRYTLTHGQILHGLQFTDNYWKSEPTTYYGRDSGVGLAIRLSEGLSDAAEPRPLRVGVVGLGTGSIAVYGRAGDRYRFYEINPAVRELSNTVFTYLSDSPAAVDVVLGDARITMERELSAGQSQQFDVLAIDAFSSDAIPVHLLSSECGEIYRKQLRPGGILAIHISNRFLDLNPVVRGLADHLGWNAFRIENDEDDTLAVYSSTWILLTESSDIAESPEIQSSHSPWSESDLKFLWTDSYSGLWRVLTL